MVVIGVILLLIASIPFPVYLAHLLSVHFTNKVSNDTWTLGIMALYSICAGASFYCFSYGLY